MKSKAYYDRKIARLKEKNPFYSNTDIAYKIILDEIVTWNLKGGERLNQEKIAELFSMSRTPIRDAFIKLENDGFLEKNDKAGHFVHKLQIREFVNFYEFRILIESKAAYLAARNIKAEGLQMLKKNIEACEKAIEKNDMEEYSRLDMKFHRIIIENCGNSYLIDASNLYKKQMLFYSNLIITNEKDTFRLMNKHREIYRAIYNSDEKLAREVMESHLGFYMNMILNTTF